MPWCTLQPWETNNSHLILGWFKNKDCFFRLGWYTSPGCFFSLKDPVYIQPQTLRRVALVLSLQQWWWFSGTMAQCLKDHYYWRYTPLFASEPWLQEEGYMVTYHTAYKIHGIFTGKYKSSTLNKERHVSHERKPTWHSIESWLFHRYPYNPHITA